MRVHRALLALALAAQVQAADGAAAPPARCNIPISDSWLHWTPGYVETLAIAQTLVAPIRRGLTPAYVALQDRFFVRLSPAEAAIHFGVGKPAIATGKGLRPYLVRAVAPLGQPSFHVGWKGDALFVETFALGCGHFLRHPVIAWLDRPPKQVFVGASGAL
jgi:hypothetical protein